MSVLAAIAVLGILIVVHELGHFAAARFQGIKVNRFSIGFGPVLIKYQGPETEYALRAFPLGGYVGFPDDEMDSEIAEDDPNLLKNRPIGDRAIVISAGVIANLVFAYFLLVGQAATIGFPQIQYQEGVLVPQVITLDSPAAKAGLQAGDIIIGVNKEKIAASKDAINQLRESIKTNGNKPIQLQIQRKDTTLNLNVEPSLDAQGNGKIGVMLAPNGTPFREIAHNPLQAFTIGTQEFERITRLTFMGFGQLITNFKENAQQVAGPVAIVAVGAQLAKDNLGNLLQFGALISINLAIINILPLPALDGGQLAFLLVEGLRGKPLPNQLQEGIMQTGLVLLLGLGVFLIVRDTANLVSF